MKAISEVKQSEIYEEIHGGSLKSSSPSIDIGENAAYESVFTNSAGQNIRTCRSKQNSPPCKVL